MISLEKLTVVAHHMAVALMWNYTSCLHILMIATPMMNVLRISFLSFSLFLLLNIFFFWLKFCALISVNDLDMRLFVVLMKSKIK